MNHEVNYYLCGGTFFSLLVQAKPADKSEPDIMKAILGTMDANYNPPPKSAAESFKGNVSDYKYCRKDFTKYLKFNNRQLRDNFDKAVREHYDNVLERMAIFVNDCIDLHHSDQWLGNSLIELLYSDQKIAGSQEFIMGADNRTKTKKELCDTQSLKLENFLLCLFHFIVTKRWDSNKQGAATIADWYTESAGGQRRNFRSEIGKYPEHDIYFLTRGVNITCSSTDKDEPIVLPPKDIISESIVNVYLNKAYEKYGKMKTLLYNDAEREFYDFYVCSTIYQRGRNYAYKKNRGHHKCL